MPFTLPFVFHPPRHVHAARHALSAHPNLPGPVVPDGWGVNIHFSAGGADQIKQIAAAGFGYVRTDLVWQHVETTPGVYNFKNYDALLNDLAPYGIHAILILDYNNKLYDPDVQTMHAPADRAAYARFAAAAAGHFKGKPVVFELWNEPNSPGFWKPDKNPVEYAEMANQAGDAMHAADPDCTVIGPAIVGYSPYFLGQAFAHGLLDHIDAVSFHPYGAGPPENRVPWYAGAYQLIQKYSNGRNVPLICSEWGFSSEIGSYSVQKQAAFLARSYLIGLASGVNLTIWYDWRNDGNNPHSKENNFGTLLYDGGMKPAYAEAQSLIKALRGFRFVKCISQGDDGKWSLMFQSGNRIARVDWDTSKDTYDVGSMPTVTYIGQ